MFQPSYSTNPDNSTDNEEYFESDLEDENEVDLQAIIAADEIAAMKEYQEAQRAIAQEEQTIWQIGRILEQEIKNRSVAELEAEVTAEEEKTANAEDRAAFMDAEAAAEQEIRDQLMQEIAAEEEKAAQKREKFIAAQISSAKQDSVPIEKDMRRQAARYHSKKALGLLFKPAEMKPQTELHPPNGQPTPHEIIYRSNTRKDRRGQL